MMIALVAVSPVQTALAVVPDVSLVLLPASQSVNLGASFNVTVQVQAGANAVDGVTVCLDFDPAVLQFNSFTVPATNPWEVSFVPATHDPANGYADTTRSTFTLPTTGTGTVDFVIVNFTALAVTGSTAIGFHAGAPRNTEVSVSAVVNDPASAVNATVSTISGTLTSITVAPETRTLITGNTLQYTATGHYALGTTDITDSVAWHSSDESIATIDASGLATGINNGTVTVTAERDGVQGSSTLTVVEAPQEETGKEVVTETVTANTANETGTIAEPADNKPESEVTESSGNNQYVTESAESNTLDTATENEDVSQTSTGSSSLAIWIIVGIIAAGVILGLLGRALFSRR